MKYNQNILNLMRDLSNAPGAPGFEDEVLTVARKALGDTVRIEEDHLRNLYFYHKKNTNDRPVIMIDAHSDEVGFMIHSIKPNGLLRVVLLGKTFPANVPCTKVLVRNADGKYIPGIFASRSPHAADSANVPALNVSDLAIDIGATSKEDAIENFRVRIGEPVVPATKFEFDEEHGIMFGKAFDCRIGCTVLIETMKAIADLDLPCDVVGVLSSQEEMLERGCKVAVNHIKPDAAFCLEGSPADDTAAEPYAVQTALREGPMLRHMDISVISNPRMQRFILDLAHEKGLKVQEAVREGGGNDASVINTAGLGVPVVTAGVPVRYIHCANCLSAYEDIEHSRDLLIEVLKNLTPERIAGF